MNTDQERAAFEAWARDFMGWDITPNDACGYESEQVTAAWFGWGGKARSALQSQSMPPEISRDLLGKIVDEVFDGAIEDASVIEDIYRVVAREYALQSQDREDVTVLKVALEESRQTMKAVLAQERLKDVAKRCLSRTIGITDRAIDHARRVEGDGM